MTDSSELIAAHFDELDHQLRGHGAGIGLSEIHGLACGLLCRGRRESRTEDWRRLVGEAAFERGIRRVLDSVFAATLNTLESADFEFRPLLPADNVTISRRVESIADWCSGFAQSFYGIDGEEPSAAAAEALSDIMNLAAMTPGDGDSETQKRNLVEIEEFLRIAAQLLFDELAPRTTNPPDLH